jgi:hypothetical protein
VSVTDRVFEALKTAILLDARVKSLADHVAQLARDARDVDKRLVRIEALIEFGSRASSTPPAIEDRRK